MPVSRATTALLQPSGKYVWFVDSDDWLFDGALEHVLPRLGSDVDLLFVNHVRVWESGRIVGAHSRMVLARAPTKPFRFREWPDIAQVFHTPWNKIVKRSLLVEHSVAFRTGVGEDVAFTFQVLSAANAIEVEPFVCYAWRTGRPGQMTSRAGEENLVWSDQWRVALHVVRPRANRGPRGSVQAHDPARLVRACGSCPASGTSAT